MEPLLKQLRELPRLIAALPAGLRLTLLLGAVAAIGVGVFNAVSSAEQYQYAFTNLTPEDSAEAAAALKTAGVPFRLEAGGSALAVPANKVYDARLLLAAAGLPRGGGVGFEIFDRGDLGVSEFTQKVNLRRATEGELARTISRLAEVRTARVHLTLPEKGLYKDQDRAAAASVVVNLRPGRTLGERELAGIRHLVSSAVPGLAPGAVAVMDGRGQVLTSEGALGEAMGWQKRLEKDLEGRVVELLEQAVGPGAVVARITATVDANEVQTSAQVVDPDSATVRSERKLSQQTIAGGAIGGGLAGAAGNQPLAASGPAAGGRGASQSTTDDQTRNFEISTTTTTTVSRVPRLQRISVAVLVDGKEGKPLPDAELARLGVLAKRAVGFDEERGDTFEISSSPFVRAEEGPGVAAPAPSVLDKPIVRTTLIGVGGLLALLIVAFALRGRSAAGAPLPILPTGARVAELEAALAREAGALPPGARAALPDPAMNLRERAKELATKDPARAASILKAWMAAEQNSPSNRNPANAS
ncbi:MAG TPA: flagellar basal-body MS-ring/collar protein FliF [Anaeromyxobacter sp.]|nr:flagellar basal-body MS-ring/collar protein FliF [Anaeromyxobacter sp.]